MSNSSTAEFYFIAGMMVLILVVSLPATYLFIRQYKREKSSQGKDGSDRNQSEIHNEKPND